MVRITATLILLAGLVMAPSALSSSDPTPAAQGLVGRTATWVSTQLHVPVPARTLRSVAVGEYDHQATVTYGANDLAVEAPIVEVWAGMEAKATTWTHDLVGLAGPGEMLVHETLHLRDSADPLNEGAVDAVAIDLTPSWMQAFLGKDATPGKGYGSLYASLYPEQVRTIRALSVKATGQRWRSRAARLWRRAYLLADDLTRAQMIEATR
jgi:hypothetical protein